MKKSEESHEPDMEDTLPKLDRMARDMLRPVAGPVLDLFSGIGWRGNPLYARNRELLAGLKDKHRGERCFIMGNGPSLKHTNLPALAGEYTFGLNRIYLLFDEMGFVPSYYVSINRHLIEQCWADISKIPRPRFIGLAGAEYLPHDDDGIIFLRRLRRPHFSRDVAWGIWEGATVTYAAMQIAHYLGFEEVILVGVDHYFSAGGRPHRVVVSRGDDPNHFVPDYFGKGMKWQLPDLHTSEMAYRMAKEAFEKDGRKIVDATIGGHLQVFPKVSFDDVVRG